MQWHTRKINGTAVNLNHKIPPPVIGLLCAFIMWLISCFTPSLILPLPLKHLSISLLIILGLLFDFSALYYFRKANTTINPLSPANTSALVTTGIYRISRNPMYVGLVFFLIALGIFLESAFSLFMVIIFIALVDRLQIRPEEEALKTIFGNQYISYKRRVRRWL